MSLRNRFKKFHEEYTKWFEAKRPSDILVSALKLGEEAGEVAEAVIAFTGSSKNKIKKIFNKGQTPKDAVTEELGDVIVVCLNVATLCNISHADLFEAAAKKAKVRTEKLAEAVK
jgi:NTP pyrophosphatase (non-canonical NTP hydrolase)